MRFIFALILAVCCCCAAESAKPGAVPKQAAGAAAEKKAAAGAKAGAPGPALSDAAIEGDIRARFARSKIASNHFQVKVQGGVATIDGTASVIQHKGAATRMAKTAGAQQVVNRIKISDAARQKATDQLAGSKRASVKSRE